MAKNAFYDFLGHPVALTTKVRQLKLLHIVALCIDVHCAQGHARARALEMPSKSTL